MIRKIKGRIRAFRRFRDDAYHSLNGWRFADLKRYIDQSIKFNEDAQLAFVMHDKHHASDVSGSLSAKIALVTCLPPDNSGIARYSMEHALASNEALDVFSFVREPIHFIHNQAKMIKRSQGQSRLFPIAALLSMHETNSYDKVVFVIGNSDHNIPVYRAMESFVKEYGPAQAVCYLHDPCCHNVVQMAKSLSHAQYFRLLTKLYDDRLLLASGDLNESWRVHQFGIDHGMLGIRAILDIGVRQFLVNSLSAKAILKDDLGERGGEGVFVNSLYHPVFPKLVDEGLLRRQRGSELVIGTYGMPGYSKKTDLVIEAARILKKRGIELRLIIAGYEAYRFASSYLGAEVPSWIEISEPDTERELQELMADCSIAVQLRKQTLGESSGVVPTLLSMGKSIIVSPLGAFEEFGEAVTMFDGDATELADLIRSEPSSPQSIISSYVAEHDLAHFCRDFVESIRF